ncbi:MAG: UDP-N-acetylglucosamine 1-carboxyvinyltransferase [Elusimicrobia bacterium]|nr:UDP-N-acetylglucosamine 1-carboxyvinyltransferase [Elusimicrobiota bacterium]
MDKIVIYGGKKLKGTVKISGSKNAALPILIATLLTDESCLIENVPSLADIDTTIGFLTYIGKKIEKNDHRVYIHADGCLKHSAPYDLVRKMRASILVTGPLLARIGRVDVSLPGGCAIGARPIDIHLDAFKRLGAKIKLKSGYVDLSTKKLIGNRIYFRFPSVGATENVLLGAVLAKGKTIIENAAREPEIADLADFLNKMGAKISGAGTKKIIIEGVNKLHGAKYRIIPDRIETATYLVATAITKGDVKLVETEPKHLKSVISKLKESGMKIMVSARTISAKWTGPLKPVNVKTEVYPFFPTDVQAQWMALMSITKGKSKIEETVFENRFLHVAELQRLGANLAIKGNVVLVKGVNDLSGAPMMVSDLRAGAALVLAALAAKGKSIISRIYHLDRGYEHLERKLKSLGANIKRIHS